MTTTDSPQAQPPEALELKPIYVASRASIPERGKMWRSFRSQGYLITSSWIDEDGEGATEDFGELWLRIASEIRRSVALVLYAEAADFPLKGALTEAGLALGMGKPVFVCLPDLGVLPRNYRPIGSWIAHPFVTRCDDVVAAMKLASRADLPRAAADDRDKFLTHFTVKVEPFYEKKHGHVPPTQGALWELLMFVQHELEARELTPRVETELSVEAALKELAELFGDKYTLIQRNDTIAFTNPALHPWVMIFRYEKFVQIQIGNGPTLDAAMQQARAWAKSCAEGV